MLTNVVVARCKHADLRASTLVQHHSPAVNGTKYFADLKKWEAVSNFKSTVSKIILQCGVYAVIIYARLPINE